MFKLITSTGEEYTYPMLRQAVFMVTVLFTTQQVNSEIFYEDKLIYDNLGRQITDEEWNNLLLAGKQYAKNLFS